MYMTPVGYAASNIMYVCRFRPSLCGLEHASHVGVLMAGLGQVGLGRIEAYPGPTQLWKHMPVLCPSPTTAVTVRLELTHLVNWAGPFRTGLCFISSGFLEIVWTN